MPLQGFLNALVYGWTREDFLDAIARRSGQRQVNGTERRDEEEEGERSSSLQQDSEATSLLAKTSERKKKRDTV